MGGIDDIAKRDDSHRDVPPAVVPALAEPVTDVAGSNIGGQADAIQTRSAAQNPRDILASPGFTSFDRFRVRDARSE